MIYIGQVLDNNADGFDYIYHSSSIALLLLQIQKDLISRCLDRLSNPEEMVSIRKLAAVETPHQLSEWFEEEYKSVQFRILEIEEG